jgi:hypothetical protein
MNLENPRTEERFHVIAACFGVMYAGFDSMKAGSMRPLLPPTSNTLHHALPAPSVGAMGSRSTID